ncbi:hypothetical protein [Mycolicibacterium pulveris]|uniref:hypothetical protein n=1 Tax=Mycolicibacterium pulveris TaxID=36813 RepID=UPI003CEC1721
MTVRDLCAESLTLLGAAKVAVSNNDWNNFDFGNPNDIHLPDTAYAHGDKVLVVFTVTTSGSADLVSFSVQDAPDDSGIGTPAAAVTDGALTELGPGDAHAHTFVRVRSDRPWLRCRVSKVGTTDSFTATAKVYAVSSGV